MKRIVYSIFTDQLDPGHKSSSDFKLSQFKKYKTQLEKTQRDYATHCGAEYKLFETTTTAYDNIQFEKLFLLEELTKDYDEVLYLDFDIVPITKLNFFDEWDLNSICAYNIERNPEHSKLAKSLRYDNFDAMNIYCKTCAKNAMLDLDGITGSGGIINTGVVGGNKESIAKLNFGSRLAEIKNTLKEAIDDNLYPEEINKHWKDNNEIFITYLIERYDVPFINIGLPWNFLLDNYHPEVSSAGYFLHHVRKEFNLSFGNIN
jgi:hypothetical protein